jgi:magnesium transporter
MESTVSSEIQDSIKSADFARLRDQLAGFRPVEVAEALQDLEPGEQVMAFRVLPREFASDVFEYLPAPAQETLVKTMGQEDVAAVLNHMADDDRTLLFGELPANVTKHLLSLLTPKERLDAITLLGYEPGTIGRLMTSHYVAVREGWYVQEVLDFVRANGRDSETLNVIYVVDERGLLIDDIRIREVLVTPLTKRVSDLMDRRFVALKATDAQEAAVEVFKREDRTALPVTDSMGVLIGIVTVDDALDVAEQAATSDMQKVGGSAALDAPYMEIPLLQMVKKRAGWLVVLFLGEMLTATAMGFFEAEIARAVVLALFVPLIISSGGNSGSQASTLVIRAMAVGEVGLRDWWLVIRRETISGLMLGGILGAIGFIRIGIWSIFSTIYGPHPLLVGATVGLTLLAIVLWGTMVGSMLPLILRRIGFDPATSSAPFVATLVDVTGLVIYFSIALVLLKGTLL